MFTSDLEQKLSLLGYSKNWINAGVLTEPLLESQLQEYSNSEDANKEHYRYRILTAYLNSHDTLSDRQVEQLIGLLQNDSDKAMASSGLIRLLKMRSLTNGQFNSVIKVLSTLGEWTKKHINKQRVIRKRENGSY